MQFENSPTLALSSRWSEPLSVFSRMCIVNSKSKKLQVQERWVRLKTGHHPVKTNKTQTTKAIEQLKFCIHLFSHDKNCTFWGSPLACRTVFPSSRVWWCGFQRWFRSWPSPSCLCEQQSSSWTQDRWTALVTLYMIQGLLLLSLGK